jgi:hypothetical protein
MDDFGFKSLLRLVCDKYKNLYTCIYLFSYPLLAFLSHCITGNACLSMYMYFRHVRGGLPRVGLLPVGI